MERTNNGKKKPKEPRKTPQPSPTMSKMTDDNAKVPLPPSPGSDSSKGEVPSEHALPSQEPPQFSTQSNKLPSDNQKGWICPACTLENEDDTAVSCEICSTPRPENANAWYCTVCTFLNQEDTKHCAICEEPRLLGVLEKDPKCKIEDHPVDTFQTATPAVDPALAEYRSSRNAAKKARRQRERLTKLQEQPVEETSKETNQQYESSVKAPAKVAATDCSHTEEKKDDLMDNGSDHFFGNTTKNRTPHEASKKSPLQQKGLAVPVEQFTETQPEEAVQLNEVDEPQPPCKTSAYIASTDDNGTDDTDIDGNRGNDSDDEARDEYRAARNAAKKARRQQERMAKLQQQKENQIHTQTECKFNKDSDSARDDTDEGFDNGEDENKNAGIVDAEAEVSSKKKKNKRQKRYEMRMQELEKAFQLRSESWQNEVVDHVRTVHLLVLLCATEIARLKTGSPAMRSQLLENADIVNDLVNRCRPAYIHLFQYDTSFNVTVVGMMQQHQQLNGRNGKIEYYEPDKGKFYVALETRRNKNTEYMFFEPGNLEPLPQLSKKKKRWGDSFAVHLPVGSFEIEKQTVVLLRDLEEKQVSDFLDNWALERNLQEEVERQAAEEDERRYREARRRAAERRKQEEEAWQREKAEFAQRKAEYEAWRKEARKQERQERRYHFGGYGRGCNCPQCAFERMFFASMFGGRGFGFGSGFGPQFFFDDDDSDDYDYDYFFEHQHEQEQEAKLQSAAEILGVTVDASLSDVKRAYYKKARKYHPDSYSAGDHDDGMTKEEAEDHFKDISNAYELMISHFDGNGE